ncbi:MAG: 1-acyl-sn-glycerol-3-phosphate acyltransferase [Aquamicrobium sp.]|uniref:lysophospholipid acyltransferase family protein n=1 Tax=Aquamicrobium sp. TaxID=1872579 RepID=UPI00349E9FD8|nr:1-acyl-sn-glycerol-3-phosphate acyltransferase [Aquamicrobium sp.]MCO5158749.1 1-acyl-sn-glycerol-3-phosphate acyltransferase [Aquamicrobium sp.]
MLALRSLAFNAAFYLSLIVQMIVWTPFYFLAPRRHAWFVPRFWSSSSMKLQQWLVGTEVHIEGEENLPAGPFILAPKHQSFWDTIAFFPYLSDPVYILKRELMWIPLFGWYVGKMRMIPINRGSRSKALKQALEVAKVRMAENRQLIIYPEGTRRPVGAEPAYKWGIAEIYATLGVPVVPVAHVAGLYWPRRKFMRYPGVIHARFLPAIEPGLEKEAFMARLIAETEAATDALLIEAARSDNPPPMPPTARERLRALGVELPAKAR